MISSHATVWMDYMLQHRRIYTENPTDLAKFIWWNRMLKIRHESRPQQLNVWVFRFKSQWYHLIWDNPSPKCQNLVEIWIGWTLPASTSLSDLKLGRKCGGGKGKGRPWNWERGWMKPGKGGGPPPGRTSPLRLKGEGILKQKER